LEIFNAAGESTLVLEASDETADDTGMDEPGGTEASIELAGTSWQLISIHGETPIEDRPLTLTFEGGGTVAGMAGCNQFGGQYSVEGDRLTIAEPATTRMACGEPTGIMEQETAYIGALASAAGYRVTDGRLEILDAAGESILVFESSNGAADAAPEPQVNATEDATGAAPSDATRIEFAASATSTTVTGRLAPGGNEQYVLHAEAGQLLEVNTSPAEGLQLSVYGVDGTVLRSGMGEGAMFRGQLPITQDYILSVSAGDEAAEYTMNVIIPEQITFALGTTSTVVEGALEAYEAHHYIFGAQAEQVLNASVTPPEAVRMTIFGVDGSVLRSGMGDGGSFQGPLPITQNYLLNLSASDEASPYRLEIEIL
jgi:heat shock protein HslJ